MQRWIVEGRELRLPLELRADRRAMLESYVRHRLRLLRSRASGLLHADDASIDDRGLALRYRSRDLLVQAARPAFGDRSFRAWRDRSLLPALRALADCHAADITGFSQFFPVGGRWIPAPAWFLPRDRDAATESARVADLQHAARWIDDARARGVKPEAQVDLRFMEHILGKLREGAGESVRDLVEAEAAEIERQGGAVGVGAFVGRLTEGELLGRLANVFRYRHLQPAETAALGHSRRDELVLELDPHWRDPDFPTVDRLSPQEKWDELLEASQTTPVLAISEEMPNPLQRAGLQEPQARWIGVHVDQPLIYVERSSLKVPQRGFVRVIEPGDDALMERKRAFSLFSETHPALEETLELAPSPDKFTRNQQLREGLEDEILACRGIFAVQGPPGTGKTHLATQVVRRFLSCTPAGRVLVCAKEHFALDNILRTVTRGLASDGIPFRAFRSLSLAKRRRGGKEIERTWLADAVTQDLARREWSGAAAGWSEWQAATHDQHDERLLKLARESANVFCCTTLDAAMVDFLGATSFDLVVVEEAGKCYPSELLHALCLGRISLMIGDQHQLPPFQERQTREGVRAWDESLARVLRDPLIAGALDARFGRLFQGMLTRFTAQGPLSEDQQSWLRPFEFLFDRLPARHRLEEQFRMEAPLSRLIGSVFYGRPFVHRKAELVAAGLLEARPLGDVVPEALDVPLLWLDTPHMATAPPATEDDRKAGVRDNRFEHDVILGYLQRLRPTRKIDLVLLTPYNAQKRLLLASDELRAACELLTDVPWERVVRTTDEYQGREAELTVISLVRNNSQGSRAWGFMTEPERLNVMFSRSRFRQVVVGCSAHVERHAAEAEWLHRVWRHYREEAKDPSCARIMSAMEFLHG